MAIVRQIVTRKVSLAEMLGISTANSLHAEFKGCVGQRWLGTLNGSTLSRVDHAALPVLSAMSMDVDARHYKLEWQSPSETRVHGAVRLGVDERVGLNATEN